MPRVESAPRYFVTPLRLSQMMEIPLVEVNRRVGYGTITPDAYAQTGANTRTPLWTIENAGYLADLARADRERDGQMRLPE